MMQIKKHQVQIKLHEEIHQIISVVIEDVCGLMYPLSPIDFSLMEKLKKEQKTLEGRPLFWSFEDGALTVHPLPDKDYERVRIRYLPIPQEVGAKARTGQAESPTETGPTETSFGRKSNSINDR